MTAARTIWVTPAGIARLDHPWPAASVKAEIAGERGRMAAILAQARPPEACGSDAPVAPARGQVAEVEMVTVREEAGRVVYETTGYRGRAALRAVDALDRIAGLTEAQRAAGRRYAAVTEAVAAGGVRCTSAAMLGGAGAGGDGREWMDRYIVTCDTLRRMHRAIGDSVGMPVRRVRPSVRGSRVAIRDRDLVDRICLRQQSPSEALRAYGWAERGETRRAIVAALAVILEKLRTC